MLKLICGLFAVILSVSGTLAFGETEVHTDPMVGLPTFTMIMTLSPADRRLYLEEVQNILVAMAEQSGETKSRLVTDNQRQITIARYNMIVALLESLNSQANAEPHGSGLANAPLEVVGQSCGYGRTYHSSSNGIGGDCSWFGGTTAAIGKVGNAMGIKNDLAKDADSAIPGTTQQGVTTQECTPKAQQAALSVNRPLLPARVYAGNIIGYDTKRPASSFCSDSKVNMAKDPTKCPAEDKVVCKGSGQQLLCNPLVFSTVNATEGICVPPGGAATANCAKAAKAHKPAFDYLANAKGPITDTWQKFSKDFNSLCTYAKGAQANANGKAMAQCSECAVMANGMKSLNTKYKDKLFVSNTDTLSTNLKIDKSSSPSSSPIPSGPGTVSH